VDDSRALQVYLAGLNKRGGEADVKLEFCVACGSKDGLQHGYLVTKAKGGSDAEANRITLCSSCYDKHEQRYGASKHSKRIKIALAARRARGASIGRPKKLLPDDCKEALRRLDGGESKAAVARSYGLSKSTVSRLVHSARLSGGQAQLTAALNADVHSGES
jgi:transposase-like protein